MDTDPDPEQEASRLKVIAEAKFKNSNLKSALKYAKKAHRLSPNLDGLSSLLTAFKILCVASKFSSDSARDWYKILQVEPFSHINTIKKQYKKLALILHPDKNSYLGCEEAFKLVAEGFRVLSDKIRRKEYDMRLRIKIQEETVNDLVGKDTFWTACSRCRLLHQFERKYLEHNLICPSCKKSFEAVEVEGGNVDTRVEESNVVRVFKSARLNRKMGSVDRLSAMGLKGKMGSGDLKGKQSDGGGEWSGGRLRRKTSTVGEVLARSKPKIVEYEETSERSKPKMVKIGEETMTLAEMQLEAKRRAKLKEKEPMTEEKASKYINIESESEGQCFSKKSGYLEFEKGVVVSKDSRIGKQGSVMQISNLKIAGRGTSKKRRGLAIERPESEDLEIMAVEDSDFYDFDKDRVERSFKKGQVWAIYDDADGMPRHYGLVDEVVKVNPFEVKMSWLDLPNNGDEGLEKMGFHVSCGRFKVSRKTSIDSLNIFSHVVDCERAAKEVYRIYPKKGSVWALYSEAALGLGVEGRKLSPRDGRSYDIVVFLTTYSEMHGLSMAYLEKVDGFKTVFKRQEIGCHAIRWLENDNIRLFSHQIPARKLTGDEVPDVLKDCWELDPASLPSELLTVSWGR